jgi:hypothetical protein
MESNNKSTASSQGKIPNPPPLEPWLIPEGAKKHAPRKKKPKGPAVVFKVAKPPEPEEEVSERPKDYWMQFLKSRSDDLEKVCEKALEMGLVSSRGAHMYFNGRCLGNGMHGSVWDMVRYNFELEAAIRVAVKKAAETPLPDVPKNIQQAIFDGWRFSRARGKALTFERSTLRGSCELVKDGTSGHLDVPFVATIAHGKPLRRL